MFTALIAISLSIVIGLAAYYFTKHRTDFTVTKKEFLLGVAISSGVLLLAAPLIEHLIIDNKTKYYEFWNGYETKAVEEVTQCQRDGDCHYTYECDPYWTLETYYDDEGEMHTRMVQKYHDCPYLQKEYNYSIETTLGTYAIGGTFASKGREGFRDREVPSHIVSGPPQFWLEAKQRIDSGKNGGVTEVHSYKNFLLASDKTILEAYSADIERYKEQKLLPDHTTKYEDPIYSYYLADKFHAVKVNADSVAWNEYLNRLNGYLGKDLQGDVHMLAVDAGAVKDVDRYAQSLFAYWKSDAFGKHAMSKNAVAVVIGVKDGKVEWARATGGLPVGNEGLFVDIRNNLRGVEFTPDSVIGAKKGQGVLFQTLWGEHKYQRPCMECIEEQQDGYNYLKSDVYVTGWQKFWIVFFATIFSIGVWITFLYVGERRSWHV